jgi:hypothetical protein
MNRVALGLVNAIAFRMRDINMWSMYVIDTSKFLSTCFCKGNNYFLGSKFKRYIYLYNLLFRSDFRKRNAEKFCGIAITAFVVRMEKMWLGENLYLCTTKNVSTKMTITEDDSNVYIDDYIIPKGKEKETSI